MLVDLIVALYSQRLEVHPMGCAIILKLRQLIGVSQIATQRLCGMDEVALIVMKIMCATRISIGLTLTTNGYLKLLQSQ
jgi:hypothetical protein